ncbi:hypothetical protein pb186bvf_017456 [Paramecium bursaria]
MNESYQYFQVIKQWTNLKTKDKRDIVRLVYVFNIRLRKILNKQETKQAEEKEFHQANPTINKPNDERDHSPNGLLWTILMQVLRRVQERQEALEDISLNTK